MTAVATAVDDQSSETDHDIVGGRFLYFIYYVFSNETFRHSVVLKRRLFRTPGVVFDGTLIYIYFCTVAAEARRLANLMIMLFFLNLLCERGVGTDRYSRSSER